MSESFSNKHTLRTDVLARRDGLSAEVRKRKSALICQELERLVAEAFADGEASRNGAATTAERTPCVAVYAAMHSEVDVQPFVDATYKRGWGVCFPCMVRERPEDLPQMAFYRIELEQLEGAHEAFLDSPLRCLTCASLERDGYERVTPDDLDVAVVPLVAFDDAGARLGYGGGNYDRLLPQLRATTLVAGVAFEEQRVSAVPTEPHDQPLPHIVTA